MVFDPLTIGMLVILGVLVFFMFRNTRKRKAAQEDLQSKIVPGAEVMTNFGLFGTLISVDELTNVAEIETSPGNIVRVHRQTLAKVVTTDENADPNAPRSVEEAIAIANREAEEREAAAKLNEDSAIPLEDPAYGERVEEQKKPRTSKKASE